MCPRMLSASCEGGLGLEVLGCFRQLSSCRAAGRKPVLPLRAWTRQAGGKIFCPEPAFTLACFFLGLLPGITVTNHPMNKTSASLSLDYL